MHYYSFNIGDYHSHTSRLSQMEDLAYRRLLDLYYLHERPFTGSVDHIAREIGMNNCLTDVEYVLNKHFPFDGENWVNKRADAEIAKYHKQKKSNSKAGKASAEARKLKASEQAFNTRSTGVQPTKNQEPITNNQEPYLKHKDTTCPSDLPDKSPIPVQQIVDLYHEILPDHPRIEKITNTRRGFIQQRWREDLSTIDSWREYFEFITFSDFLMGRTEPRNGKPPFMPNLEWLTRPGNYAKILEETYHGQDWQQAAANQNSGRLSGPEQTRRARREQAERERQRRDTQ